MNLLFVGFFIFFLGTGIAAYLARRASRSEEAFLVARGRLGPIIGAGTLTGTQISAGTALGFVGLVVVFGPGIILLWPFVWAGWLVNLGWVAPRLRLYFERKGGMTIPEMLSDRFDGSKAVRILAVVIMTVGFTILLVAETLGGALILQVLFGIPREAAALAFVFGIIAYTLVGGFLAVAYADLFQCTMMLAGFVWAALLVLSQYSGFSALVAAAANAPISQGSGLGLAQMILFGLSFFLIIIGYPALSVRFFAINGRKAIRKAVAISIGAQVFIALSLTVVGLGAAAILGAAVPDRASLQIATSILPPVAGGLLIGAITAAIVSTHSALLILIGGSAARDVVGVLRPTTTDKTRIWITRVGVCLAGVIPILVVLNPLPLIQLLVRNAAVVLASSFGITTLAAMHWKRMGTAAAIASMGAGFVGATLWFLANRPFGLDPIIPGILFALIGLLLGTYLGKPASTASFALFHEGLEPKKPGSESVRVAGTLRHAGKTAARRQ